MKVLITGGNGYIGTHISLELLKKNYDLSIIDNFSNSKKINLKKIKEISKKSFSSYNCDLKNYLQTYKILKKINPDVVIHLAGYKSVSESEKFKKKYHKNNVTGAKNLFKSMQQLEIKKIIFSSSATIYGTPKYLPIDEKHPIKAVNYYGKNKIEIEKKLKEYSNKFDWSVISLRYFNPVGAHSSNKVGDDPKFPENLMPNLCLSVKKKFSVNVYGNNYRTKDGSAIRDYIHIEDLANAHIKAINKLKKKQFLEFNLGTGKGYSVFELLKTYEKVNKVKIKYEIKPRRKGDVPIMFSSCGKANKYFKWRAFRTLSQMCKSAHKFYNNKNKRS
jgi:UDP-glucose 4-epimerase|tara:strand:+ start:2855 stop:3850 length:996 start_codon:yes stop_codon:yes gene_type:complete